MSRDYAAGAEHLKRGSLVNRYFWNYALGHSFRSLLRRHSDVFLKAASTGTPDPFNPLFNANAHNASFPDRIHSKPLLSLTDIHVVLDKPLITLTDFIDKFIAPLEGYESSEALYRDASSLHYMKNVKVPCLALNSMDDEITRATIPYAEVCLLIHRTLHLEISSLSGTPVCNR